MDPGTFFIASFDAVPPLGVAIESPSSLPPTGRGGRSAGDAAEIPLSRPGTDCTLMLESLIMALVRQMPLKQASSRHEEL